jgi:hypothetical protein
MLRLSTLIEQERNLTTDFTDYTDDETEGFTFYWHNRRRGQESVGKKDLTPPNLCNRSNLWLLSPEICGLFFRPLAPDIVSLTSPSHPGEKNCRCFIREVASSGSPKWQMPADRQLGNPVHQ